MERRSFLKVVGLASAAVAAGGMLAGCDAVRHAADGVAVGSAESTAAELSAKGQPAVKFATTVDVLVVGSGVAGLSAAMAPAEAGLSVYVAEKQDLLGGDSYTATGLMHAADSDVQKRSGVKLDAAAAWKARKAELSAMGVPDLDFAKTLYEGASQWVDHVETTYKSQFANPSSYEAEGLAGSVVLPKNGLDDMESVMVPIRDGLAAKGVTFSTGYRAVGFVVDGTGAVRGMRFSTEQGNATIDIGARCVVVATGGYVSSQSMVRTNNPDWYRAGCYVAYSVGEGQQLCAALGATMGGYTAGLPLVADLPAASAWGMFAPTLGVDATGTRFAREDDMNSLATGCYSGARGLWWTIYDGALNSCSQSRSVASITSKNAKRTVGPCDKVGDLAAAMGVPADALAATFERYEELVDAGKDEDCGRTAHLEKLAAPYYAIKLLPVRYRTRGGVKTDAQGRVLRTAGAAAVPGVYCCGAAAAGGGEGIASNGAFGLMTGQAVVEYLNGGANTAGDGASAGDGAASGADDAVSGDAADADAAAPAGDGADNAAATA